MTAITRARAAIDAIAGKSISAEKATRVVNAYAPNPELSNEEKSDIFLSTLKAEVLEKLRGHAVSTVSDQVNTLHADARASAQQDLE